MLLTEDLALKAIAARNSNKGVTVQEAISVFAAATHNKTHSFATLLAVTDVALAACHKADQQFVKISYVNFYGALNKTAIDTFYIKQMESKTGVTDWKTTDTYCEHLQECWSICKHNTSDQHYISLVCNNNTKSEALYFDCVNNCFVDKTQVAAYCTKSQAKTMLMVKDRIVNKTNGVDMQVAAKDVVTYRNFKLQNVVQLKANATVFTDPSLL